MKKLFSFLMRTLVLPAVTPLMVLAAVHLEWTTPLTAALILAALAYTNTMYLDLQLRPMKRRFDEEERKRKAVDRVFGRPDPGGLERARRAIALGEARKRTATRGKEPPAA